MVSCGVLTRSWSTNCEKRTANSVNSFCFPFVFEEDIEAHALRRAEDALFAWRALEMWRAEGRG